MAWLNEQDSTLSPAAAPASASPLLHSALYLLTAVAALCIAASTLLRAIRHAKRHSHGPPGHWLLGNLDLLTKGKIQDNFLAGTRRYGPLYSIRIFQWPIWVLSDPPSISKIFKGGPSVAGKVSEGYHMFDRMTYPKTQSMLSAQDGDPYWKVVRAAAAQAFATKNLKVLFHDIVEATNTAVTGPTITSAVASRQGQGTPSSVDVDALCLRITVDILGSFLLGHPFGASAGGPCPVLEVVEHESKMVGEAVKSPYRAWMVWNKEVRQEERWNREFAALIRSMLADLRSSPPPPHTLAAHLLAAKVPHTGGPLPDNRLCAELALILMAGFENTGHSAALALFAIIAHPEVEERVTAELDTLGLLATPSRPTPRPLEWGDLAKLQVLSAAVQESMRWLPTVPQGTMKMLRQDVEVMGKVLRKGEVVWVPFISAHRDPHNWERPDEYDIDRWLGSGAVDGGLTQGLDDAEHSKASKGYLPFSEGPRNCVGQALARVELLVVLAQLLGSFRVELAPGMGGKEGVLRSLEMRMSMRPEHGLWCCVQPRGAAACLQGLHLG